MISGLAPKTRMCVDAVEVGTLMEGPAPVTRTIARDEVAAHQLTETFPILDTMRAVGALAVVTTHCGF